MNQTFVIAFFSTLVFTAVAYFVYPAGRGKKHNVSLVISAYGILTYWVLRSNYGNIYYGSTGPNNAFNMVVSGGVIFHTSLIISIILNILQWRSHPTRMYKTTLGAQILLLIVTAWFWVLAWPLL